MERSFKPGTIVQHFKRETVSEEELKNNPNKYLYEIIGTSAHTETKELLMIYKPLYSTNCFTLMCILLFLLIYYVADLLFFLNLSSFSFINAFLEFELDFITLTSFCILFCFVSGIFIKSNSIFGFSPVFIYFAISVIYSGFTTKNTSFEFKN